MVSRSQRASRTRAAHAAKTNGLRDKLEAFRSALLEKHLVSRAALRLLVDDLLGVLATDGLVAAAPVHLNDLIGHRLPKENRPASATRSEKASARWVPKTISTERFCCPIPNVF